MRWRPKWQSMSEHENQITAEDPAIKNKVLGLCGFAKRAGKLVVGTDHICDEIRRHGIPRDAEGVSAKPIGIVLLSSDASENTKKRITNACLYYQVPYRQTAVSSEELAARIGKNAAAACATFDKGFSDGLKKVIGLTPKRVGKS